MDDRQLCWDILPAVSRSFSVCIKMLPKPVDQQMMLSYMLYRVIDTIEDSNAPLKEKRRLFNRVIVMMSQDSYPAEKVHNTRIELLENLNYTYEKPLLENLDALMREYYHEPAPIRKSILKWGRIMANGMYRFQSKGIDTFKDQDRYSHYVAGVVGYLINDLLYHNKIITEEARKKLHAHSRRFGLALQKVNILRDVSHDVGEGRYYWPRATLAKYGINYDGLLESKNRDAAMKVLKEEINDSLTHLYSGMFYVVSLPKEALQVRMFCLIPLFMAIESYAKCVNNHEVFEREKTVKITRVQVHEIIAKSGLWGTSNDKIVQWFSQTLSQADPKLARSATNRLVMKMNCSTLPVHRNK